LKINPDIAKMEFNEMKEAYLYEKLENKKVRCFL